MPTEPHRTMAALDRFREYARDPLATPTKITRAKELIAELEPNVAVLILTTEPGTPVVVGGEFRGTVPLATKIELGPDVVLSPSGPGMLRLTLDLPPPQAEPVSLPAPTPAPVVRPVRRVAVKPAANAPSINNASCAGERARGDAVIAAALGLYFTLQNDGRQRHVEHL